MQTPDTCAIRIQYRDIIDFSMRRPQDVSIGMWRSLLVGDVSTEVWLDHNTMISICEQSGKKYYRISGKDGESATSFQSMKINIPVEDLREPLSDAISTAATAVQFYAEQSGEGN